MTERRLIALLDDLRALPAETEWVEFKVNNNDADRMARTAAALSNSARLMDKPFGYMIWGVEDETHRVVGTDFEPGSAKRANQPLEIWLAKHLNPSPHFRFITVSHPDGRVVILEIPAASTVPIKYNDIAYIRIGNATPKLSDYPDREAALLERLRPYVWEQGVAAIFVTDEEIIELLDIESYFRLTKQQQPEGHTKILERLQEDRLIAADVGGRWNILNLGAILFAKRLDRFDRLARKAVRVIQYEGENRVKTLRRQEGGRGYASGFEGLIDFIDTLLPSEENIGNALREVRRTYPVIAVRELVVNALIHQDMTITGAGPMIEIYSNRIEITNPGVPVTDMLRKLFGAPPRSRNELLATLMRRMRICEEQGSGLVKVIWAAEQQRLPAPEFKVIDDSLRVTLHGPRSFADMDRDDRVMACYQHTALMFHSGKRMTNASLRERFGIEERNAAQVSRVIRECLSLNFIRLADPERPKAGYVPFWA